MTFDGEGPFKGCRITKYNRKTDNRCVITIAGFGKRTSMTYSRYLMCIKENRILSVDEHVDHKDENKTHDNIDNLQILTPAENTIKNLKARHIMGRIHVICICPICGNRFSIEIKKYNEKTNKGYKPVCSTSCVGKLSGESRRNESLSNKILLNDYEEINGYFYDNFVVGYILQ